MTREINRLRLKPYKIIYKNQQLHGEKSNELKERENLYSTTMYKSVVARSKTSTTYIGETTTGRLLQPLAFCHCSNHRGCISTLYGEC